MPRAKPAKPPIAPEREVLAGVLDACRQLGIDARRTNTGAAMNAKGRMVRFGAKGDADVQGQLPDGRKLSVEVKRKGQKPSPEQWDHIHRVNASNGCAFYVDDAKDAYRVLEKLKQGWWVEIDAAGHQTVTDGKGE